MKLAAFAFSILASMLIAASCIPMPNNNEMGTPTFIETAKIETPSIPPTITPEQNSNSTIQYLDIHQSTFQNIESIGNIVLQDYYNNKSLFAIHLPSDSLNPTIFGEGFLAPVISPSGKILAYLDEYDKDPAKMILVNSNSEAQKTLPWKWGFIWGPKLAWINNNQLVINPYSDEQMIIFNPFTGDVKNIAFNQFPGFDFILTLPWADFDPTLSLVVYPKGGSSALFDVENKQILAEVPTGVQRGPLDVSWTVDGSSAAVIGSIFSPTGHLGDELFIVSRSGIVEQITDLVNYFGKGVSLRSPQWSPNANQIAFWEMDALDNYQDRKLAIVDLSTKQVTIFCMSGFQNQYSDYGEYLPAPIWSLDSTQILIENRYSKDHNKVILIDIPKNIAVQIAQDARPIGWLLYEP